MGRIYHTMFYDFNENGVYDQNDSYLSESTGIVHIAPGDISTSNLYNGGSVDLLYGTYTITHQVSYTDLTTDSTSYTVTLDSVNDIDTIYFGFVAPQPDQSNCNGPIILAGDYATNDHEPEILDEYGPDQVGINYIDLDNDGIDDFSVYCGYCQPGNNMSCGQSISALTTGSQVSASNDYSAYVKETLENATGGAHTFSLAANWATGYPIWSVISNDTSWVDNSARLQYYRKSDGFNYIFNFKQLEVNDYLAIRKTNPELGEIVYGWIERDVLSIGFDCLGNGWGMGFGSFARKKFWIEDQLEGSIVGDDCDFSLAGRNYLDVDMNGCDINDPSISYLVYEASDDSINTNLYSDSLGDYELPLSVGNYTLEVSPSYSTLFNSSPNVIVANFDSTSQDSIIQNFCLTPIGTQNDLEVLLFSQDIPSAGFDVPYKIIYKNNGNTVLSGTVTVTYESDVMDFVVANPPVTSQQADNLSWDYSDLLPFETREIFFTVNLNSPLEIPPLESGHSIEFAAEITPLLDDISLSDNTFNLTEYIVNSYDPNDKTCLEGNYIDTTQTEDYLHYKIRFENLGTAPAITVIIKDEIDTTLFDISSLQTISASHNYDKRIMNGTRLEYLFGDIYLPYTPGDNTGYVLFKIKPKPGLVLGDSLVNEASIYFDFNEAIQTNKEVVYVGIDQDGDGYYEAEDCDDTNAMVNPEATEIVNNGVDENCDGYIAQDVDLDGYWDDVDCDDTNAMVNPGAIEIVNNGVDENCDGYFAQDVDLDSYWDDVDCDDANAMINPGAIEIIYNGFDDDCDETTLDDDLDQDGFPLAEDCDDMNASINPGITEITYNGIDDDCNESTLDDDLDEDGFPLADDCDDTNALINPDAIEIPNNGIDEDCLDGDLIVSNHEALSRTLEIYPNPTSGIIEISLPDLLQTNLIAKDYRGKTLLQKSIQEKGRVDLSDFPDGVYILLLQTEEYLWIERVVKM